MLLKCKSTVGRVVGTSRSAISSSDDFLVLLVLKAQLTVYPACMAVKQTNKITLWSMVSYNSGAIAQSETGCIAYTLTGFVVVARFFHYYSYSTCRNFVTSFVCHLLRQLRFLLIPTQAVVMTQ